MSVPERRYDLVGQLLAGALVEADRSGDSPRAVLDRCAYQLGKELGYTARSAAGSRNAQDIALRVLEEHGFEPRVEAGGITLGNCPFHALAQEHPELVCRANLRLLEGLLDGLARHRADCPSQPEPGPVLRTPQAPRHPEATRLNKASSRAKRAALR